MEILGVILARGGSKGIPRKNIKQLNGYPLIYYTIRACQQSKKLTRYIVNTEDAQIKAVAKAYGSEVVDRTLKLAQDDTSNVLVWKHTLQYLKDVENYIPSIMVNLNPTSPLRESNDIDNAVRMLIETNCDAVISVTKEAHRIDKIHTLDEYKKINFCWPFREEELKSEWRQGCPDYYLPNGAITAVWIKHVLKGNSWKEIFVDNVEDLRAFVMPPERSVDVDTVLDFKIAEMLLKR